MAQQVYRHTRGVQDHDARMVYRAFERIIQLEYPGVESMVGAQFWGTNELEISGLHNEVLYHTGLLGQAAKIGRELRHPVPMSHYELADQIIADYEILGIGYEYYPDELEDDLYDIVPGKVSDLPKLLAEAEEEEHYFPYNNGESFTSGWADTPMFVDGSTQFLKTIGRPDVNLGSNIIENAGGPSYHLISTVEQYGMHFVNEEGRISPLQVERVMCSPQNARLLSMYYGAPYNVEQDNTAVPNPVMSSPTIIPSHRLANSDDMIFFFEGWQQDMKERHKWRARSDSDTIGHLNEKRVVTITRSRYSYYFFNNRRVLLVKGAP